MIRSGRVRSREGLQRRYPQTCTKIYMLPMPHRIPKILLRAFHQLLHKVVMVELNQVIQFINIIAWHTHYVNTLVHQKFIQHVCNVTLQWDNKVCNLEHLILLDIEHWFNDDRREMSYHLSNNYSDYALMCMRVWDEVRNIFPHTV